MNITITIPDNILTKTVGLPTRASGKTGPAFSGSFPNDWLSPTDLFLNAHGIGQCGALDPISLLSFAPDVSVFTNTKPLLVFFGFHYNADAPVLQ